MIDATFALTSPTRKSAHAETHSTSKTASNKDSRMPVWFWKIVAICRLFNRPVADQSGKRGMWLGYLALALVSAVAASGATVETACRVYLSTADVPRSFSSCAVACPGSVSAAAAFCRLLCELHAHDRSTPVFLWPPVDAAAMHVPVAAAKFHAAWDAGAGNRGMDPPSFAVRHAWVTNAAPPAAERSGTGSLPRLCVSLAAATQGIPAARETADAYCATLPDPLVCGDDASTPTRLENLAGMQTAPNPADLAMSETAPHLTGLPPLSASPEAGIPLPSHPPFLFNSPAYGRFSNQRLQLLETIAVAAAWNRTVVACPLTAVVQQCGLLLPWVFDLAHLQRFVAVAIHLTTPCLEVAAGLACATSPYEEAQPTLLPSFQPQWPAECSHHQENITSVGPESFSMADLTAHCGMHVVAAMDTHASQRFATAAAADANDANDDVLEETPQPDALPLRMPYAKKLVSSFYSQ